MAFEWQTAFVVYHKMPWCALLTAVNNKSLEKLQDFFVKTETKTKTKCSRPRLHDPRPRLSFLSLRCLEIKTLVWRTKSLKIPTGNSSAGALNAWKISQTWSIISETVRDRPTVTMEH